MTTLATPPACRCFLLGADERAGIVSGINEALSKQTAREGAAQLQLPV